MPKISGQVDRAKLHEALDHLLNVAQEDVDVKGISELSLSFEKHPSEYEEIYDTLSMDMADEYIQAFIHKHEEKKAMYSNPIIHTSVVKFYAIDPD